MKNCFLIFSILINSIIYSQISNYQPLEPLPVIIIDAGGDEGSINNKSILERLPDETTRLVSKELTNSTEAGFKSFISISKKNEYYTVLFDWIKYNASVALSIDENNVPKLLLEPTNNVALAMTEREFYRGEEFDLSNLDSLYINRTQASETNIVKIIIGVGIRVKANIKSDKKGIKITDLFGLGASAENKKISGSLEIQSMGITGKAITSLIPLPVELNKSSIQSLLTNIAAIREKIYTLEFEDDDTFLNVQITPRVIGYEDLSGKNYTLNQIQSFIYRATPYIIVNQFDFIHEGG